MWEVWGKSMGCHGNCLMLPRTQSSPIHLHTQTRDLKQEAPSLLSVCVPPPPCPQSPSPLAHRHGASRQAIPSLSAHLRRWLAWYRVSAMPWRGRRAPGGGAGQYICHMCAELWRGADVVQDRGRVGHAIALCICRSVPSFPLSSLASLLSACCLPSVFFLRRRGGWPSGPAGRRHLLVAPRRLSARRRGGWPSGPAGKDALRSWHEGCSVGELDVHHDGGDEPSRYEVWKLVWKIV